MPVTIIRKKAPVCDTVAEVPVFSVGDPVVVGSLRFARGLLFEGLEGVVSQLLSAGGMRDVRPRDDLYRVQFAGFIGYLYFGELVRGKL